MLTRMDANADRRLMRGEIPAELLPLFERFLPSDTNKNGLLEPAEITEAAPRLARMAAQSAQQLGIDVPSELEKLPPLRRAQFDLPTRRRAAMSDVGQLFARLDQDGDGRIIVVDAPQRLQEALARADRDGDGAVVRTEFEPVARQIVRASGAPLAASDQQPIRQRLRRMLGRNDANGDGALSIEEAPQQIAQSFSRFDRDQDGRLAGEELVPK
jgi:Ca2+-binding EF-hand superfamily protein